MAGDEVFTSGLSPSEFLLVRDAGFESVGLAMGSSVCHIGLSLTASVARLTAPSYGTMYSVLPASGGEVVQLTRAMSTARKAAMQRLTDDARGLGADGVIGITVETVWDSWYDGALEFTLTGTAVRRTGRADGGDGGDGSADGRDRSGPGAGLGSGNGSGSGDGRVFTCCLSGQEFRALLRSGYRPAGLVMGYCVYVAEPEYTSATRELRGPTRAVYAARELVIERMRSQAGHDFQAKGIVGVTLEGLDGLGRLPNSRVLEFRALGTAIVPVDGAADAPPGRAAGTPPDRAAGRSPDGLLGLDPPVTVLRVDS